MKPHLPLKLCAALLAALSIFAKSSALADENKEWTDRITDAATLEYYDLVNISNKSGSESGGAINTYDEVTIAHSGAVQFTGNVVHDDQYNGCCGGAIFNDWGTLSFSNNGNISFTGNKGDTAGQGGAIYDGYGTMSFTGNQNISFQNNQAGGDGGAIFRSSWETMSFTGNQNISFENNKSSKNGHGGAIYNELGTLAFSGNKDIVFTGNEAARSTNNGGKGGAIYNYTDVGEELSFTGNGDISFTGNKADYLGGAIYNNDSELTIAGNGNVTFRGNFERDVNVGAMPSYGKQLRSLYSVGSNAIVTLSATTGKSITFYDSIYTNANTTVELNKSYEDADGNKVAATGAIVFSGKYTAEDLAAALGTTPTDDQIKTSLTSEIGKATTLCAGSLEVRDGAILNATGITVQASADTEGGTKVVLANGTLNSSLSFESGTSLHYSGTNNSVTDTWSFAQGAGIVYDRVENGADSSNGTLTFADGAKLQFNESYIEAVSGKSGSISQATIEHKEVAGKDTVSICGTASTRASLDDVHVDLAEGSVLELEDVALGSGVRITDDPATVLFNGTSIDIVKGANATLTTSQTSGTRTLKDSISGENVSITFTKILQIESSALTMVSMGGTSLTLQFSGFDVGNEDLVQLTFQDNTQAATFADGLKVIGIFGGTSYSGMFSDAMGNSSVYFSLKNPYVPEPVVPEPATATLSLLALAGLFARRRRK